MISMNMLKNTSNMDRLESNLDRQLESNMGSAVENLQTITDAANIDIDVTVIEGVENGEVLDNLARLKTLVDSPDTMQALNGRKEELIAALAAAVNQNSDELSDFTEGMERIYQAFNLAAKYHIDAEISAMILNANLDENKLDEVFEVMSELEGKRAPLQKKIDAVEGRISTLKDTVKGYEEKYPLRQNLDEDKAKFAAAITVEAEKLAKLQAEESMLDVATVLLFEGVDPKKISGLEMDHLDKLAKTVGARDAIEKARMAALDVSLKDIVSDESREMAKRPELRVAHKHLAEDISYLKDSDKVVLSEQVAIKFSRYTTLLAEVKSYGEAPRYLKLERGLSGKLSAQVTDFCLLNNIDLNGCGIEDGKIFVAKESYTGLTADKYLEDLESRDFEIVDTFEREEVEDGRSFESLASGEVVDAALSKTLKADINKAQEAVRPLQAGAKLQQSANGFAKMVRKNPKMANDRMFVSQMYNELIGGAEAMADGIRESRQNLMNVKDELTLKAAGEDPKGEMFDKFPQLKNLWREKMHQAIAAIDEMLTADYSPLSLKSLNEAQAAAASMRAEIDKAYKENLKKVLAVIAVTVAAVAVGVAGAALAANIGGALFGTVVAGQTTTIGLLGTTTPWVVSFANASVGIGGMAAGGVIGKNLSGMGVNALAGEEMIPIARNMTDLRDEFGEAYIMMAGALGGAKLLGAGFGYMAQTARYPWVASLGRGGYRGMNALQHMMSPHKWMSSGNLMKAAGHSFAQRTGVETAQEFAEMGAEIAGGPAAGFAAAVANSFGGGFNLDLNLSFGSMGISVDANQEMTYRAGNAEEFAANLEEKLAGKDVQIDVNEDGTVSVDFIGNGKGARFEIAPAEIGLTTEAALQRTKLVEKADGSYQANSVADLSAASEVLGKNGFVFKAIGSGMVEARSLRNGETLKITVDSMAMIEVKAAVEAVGAKAKDFIAAVDNFRANPTAQARAALQKTMMLFSAAMVGCGTDSNLEVVKNVEFGNDFFTRLFGSEWIGAVADFPANHPTITMIAIGSALTMKFFSNGKGHLLESMHHWIMKIPGATKLMNDNSVLGRVNAIEEGIQNLNNPRYSNIGAGEIVSLTQSLHDTLNARAQNFLFKIGTVKGKLSSALTVLPFVKGFDLGVTRGKLDAIESGITKLRNLAESGETQLFQISEAVADLKTDIEGLKGLPKEFGGKFDVALNSLIAAALASWIANKIANGVSDNTVYRSNKPPMEGTKEYKPGNEETEIDRLFDGSKDTREEDGDKKSNKAKATQDSNIDL